MGNNWIKYVMTETDDLHDMSTEVYEELMDLDKEKAVKILDKIAEKARSIKADLLISKN